MREPALKNKLPMFDSNGAYVYRAREYLSFPEAASNVDCQGSDMNVCEFQPNWGLKNVLALTYRMYVAQSNSYLAIAGRSHTPIAIIMPGDIH
jgi:hypothetical protein